MLKLASVLTALLLALSLQRHGLANANLHGVVFEPEAMAKTMLAMLGETGHCRVLFRTEFKRVAMNGGRVQNVTVQKVRFADGKSVVESRTLVADHPCDTHGGHNKGIKPLREPCGVPFRCLIPKGTRNLLITCRAASFSSIAASSCRLSRTMMQLGQAAGTAVALAKELKVELPDVPAERLRESLRKQHVQIEHPMLGELRAYLEKEQP